MRKWEQNKTFPTYQFAHKYSVQQQIHFNGNVFGNKCCCRVFTVNVSKITEWVTNSVEHSSVASDLGLYYLLRPVSPTTWNIYSTVEYMNKSTSPWSHPHSLTLTFAVLIWLKGLFLTTWLILTGVRLPQDTYTFLFQFLREYIEKCCFFLVSFR